MRATVWVLLGLLALGGCGKKEMAPADAAPAAYLAKSEGMRLAKAQTTDNDTGSTPDVPDQHIASVPRHIELHHAITLEVPASQLEAVWHARLDACQLPACEVVSATIENYAGDAESAELSLRIVPAQVDKLLGEVQGSGRVLRHELSQTDRTSEVVDYQARLTNQKTLRDRLRTLAAAPGNKVADVLNIERELARTQGEIDSLEGQIRAALAVTEKVNFDLSFKTPATLGQPGSWSPVGQAWREMGSTFASSVATLMLFVAGGLPWFVLLGIVIWALRRVWRWRKARKLAQG